MPLTHRQTAIVRVLLDLYRSAQEPISYRVVAEHLSVSAPTAYRMLRLAEAQGYVEAVYAPRPAGGGAGRSAVLFAPTDLARRLLDEVAGPNADADWEATKRRVLEALDSGRLAHGEYISELLAELEAPGSPVATAGRLIAALMIALEESPTVTERRELPTWLTDGGGRMGLAALGGMLVGLTRADRTRRAVSARLENQLQNLTSAIAVLSPADEADLREFVRQLGRRLRTGSQAKREGAPRA